MKCSSFTRTKSQSIYAWLKHSYVGEHEKIRKLDINNWTKTTCLKSTQNIATMQPSAWTIGLKNIGNWRLRMKVYTCTSAHSWLICSRRLQNTLTFESFASCARAFRSVGAAILLPGEVLELSLVSSSLSDLLVYQNGGRTLRVYLGDMELLQLSTWKLCRFW